jgi:hypothetical protein
LSKIYIKDTIFFSIYTYKFIAPEIYLGDSLFSGDISLSPTKGEGPLVRASSPTIRVSGPKPRFKYNKSTSTYVRKDNKGSID